MSDDEIKIIIEGAFQPLRCTAEFCDYNRKLKFLVREPERLHYLRGGATAIFSPSTTSC
jgi:hypothetical protein